MNYISTFSGGKLVWKGFHIIQMIHFFPLVIHEITFRWPQLQNQKEWNFQKFSKIIKYFHHETKMATLTMSLSILWGHIGYFSSGTVPTEIAVLMYTKLWNSADTTNPQKILPSNDDHIKLFSSFPHFQQFWGNHFFSWVLLIGGELCVTQEKRNLLRVS